MAWRSEHNYAGEIFHQLHLPPPAVAIFIFDLKLHYYSISMLIMKTIVSSASLFLCVERVASCLKQRECT